MPHHNANNARKYHGKGSPDRGKMVKGRHTGGPGGAHKKQGCCSYQEAGRAITRLQFRLAARYIRMDVKARLGII